MIDSAWRFSVLGDFEVRRAGEPVAITPGKLQLLLVALLLNGNHVVPPQRIEEMLWPDRRPASVQNTIHTYVTRLRRLLGDEAPIRTHSAGYLIEVDPGWVDVNHFQKLLADADKAAQCGDTTAEHAALTAALQLWRGSALSGLPSVAPIADMAWSLEEQRLQACERRASIDVTAGRFDLAIPEMQTVIHRHPLRDAAWETLIRALSGSGRTAQALDAYRKMRQVFHSELGVEPNERVQLLHQEILAMDRLVDESGPPTESDARIGVRPSQMPIVPRGFAGRTTESDTVVRWLSDDLAPVVVSGPPGAGKTAFALHVAHRIRAEYPDGHLYVDLQGYSLDAPLEAGKVLTRFLRALGVRSMETPEDVVDKAALFRSVMADRRLLIVLDNAASSDQVRPLLPGMSANAVIVTSRDELRGLSVSGARSLRLDVLDEDDSRAVLVEMLGADRVMNESAAATGLVRRCTGLPLALRIAGANLAANPQWRLADYLNELITQGTLERLRIPGDEEVTVEKAFDMSYDWLSPDVARTFRLLGLIPTSSFTVGEVAALIGDDESTAQHYLETLHTKNLIVAYAPQQYRFHDLIREHMLAMAAEDPERVTAAARWQAASSRTPS